MSLFDYFFDNEWFQRSDINRLNTKTDAIEARMWQSKGESRDAAREVLQLRQEVSRLVLLLETTQRMLFDKGLCTREEFGRMIRAIDAEDGLVDGQVGRSAGASEELRYCDGCQHFNAASLPKCQYCGRKFGT